MSEFSSECPYSTFVVLQGQAYEMAHVKGKTCIFRFFVKIVLLLVISFFLYFRESSVKLRKKMNFICNYSKRRCHQSCKLHLVLISVSLSRFLCQSLMKEFHFMMIYHFYQCEYVCHISMCHPICYIPVGGIHVFLFFKINSDEIEFLYVVGLSHIIRNRID